MRFSLLGVIGFVALAAVGCAALVNANDVWLVAVSTLTFAIVMASSLVGLLGRGSMRGFAIGFAFCCTAYLLVIYFGLTNENAGTGHIATTRALKRIYSTVAVQAPSTPGNKGTYTLSSPLITSSIGPFFTNGGTTVLTPAPNTFLATNGFVIASNTTPDRNHFMQIGQQLWALLIGCLGGVFASWLWRRRLAVRQ